jgi:hypothetical protein
VDAAEAAKPTAANPRNQGVIAPKL